jgi:hypothetical protein
MTTAAEKRLAKLLADVPENLQWMVKGAFLEGFNEGRRQMSVLELLEECKKWQMTDEEAEELMK